jgi:hypothetical protein
VPSPVPVRSRSVLSVILLEWMEEEEKFESREHLLGISFKSWPTPTVNAVTDPAPRRASSIILAERVRCERHGATLADEPLSRGANLTLSPLPPLPSPSAAIAAVVVAVDLAPSIFQTLYPTLPPPAPLSSSPPRVSSLNLSSRRGRGVGCGLLYNRPRLHL